MDGLLLQKPEKEAAGQKKTENFIRIDRIAPYVRYVNYKIFEGGTLLPERIIYDHELIYCLSGEAVFLYNGSEYRIRKGELFLSYALSAQYNDRSRGQNLPGALYPF